MKFYAGIGSRETPRDMRERMTYIAEQLSYKGYTLRSGGAHGADTAFEWGSRGKKEIYLPWAGFNGRPKDVRNIVCGSEIWLRDIAIDHYPRGRWHRLREPVKKLMTRNSAQILGRGFGEPISEFVICWTPEGKGGGGTGQAIRVARSYGVPVYDLAIEENIVKVEELCTVITAQPRTPASVQTSSVVR